MMPVNTKLNLPCVAAALIVFLMPVSVLSATLPLQGPYAGAYLGGGFGKMNPSTNAGSVSGASYFSSSADINAVNNAGSWTEFPNTMIVGAEAGHDWVWQQLIYGVAFDYSALPLNSSRSTTAIYPDNSDQYSVSTSMQTNWLFTLRGRFGYQFALAVPSLIYVTAGMAITQLKVSNSFSDNSALAGAGSSSTAQNQIGWTAGAGIEVPVFDHATIDAEYGYVAVPSVKSAGYISNTGGGFGIPPQSLNSLYSTSADFHANIFKVGINYHFDE